MSTFSTFTWRALTAQLVVFSLEGDNIDLWSHRSILCNNS